MRFGSPYTNFQAILWATPYELLANGAWRPTGTGFTARFRGGDFDDFEKNAMYERFGNVIRRGSRFADDTLTTPAPTEWRIGTFDTSTIEDEKLRERVETALLNHPDHGRDFIHLERPKPAAPWPGYDKLVVRGKRTMQHVLSTMRSVIEQAGIDPDTVEAYERANLNRPEVFVLLDEVRQQAGDPEDEFVAA